MREECGGVGGVGGVGEEGSTQGIHERSVVQTRQSKTTTPREKKKSCLRQDLNPQHSAY